jgi:4-amino-4-deoxy-L-arabinose transferase-like glycosyltransferase
MGRIFNDPIYYKILLIIAFSVGIIFYVRDILKVPFHPDESTQIFMSSDIEFIANGKLPDLFYTDLSKNNLRQTYRLLDAPITRYYIGLFRLIFNQPNITIDWDWSKSWQQNQNALPSNSLLFFTRLSVAFLFPATILIYYFLWKEIFNHRIAILGTIFLSTNSIILLHTRRAMAESGLLFYLGLSLLFLLKLPRKYLFLSAIPIGLAINTKQSLFPLIFVAFMMIIYKFREFRLYKGLISLFIFFTILITVTYMLNPVMWKHPISVAVEMVMQRSLLTDSQINAIGFNTPEFILDTPFEKITGFLAQTFITKPAYQDISNYQSELSSQISQYQSLFLYSGYGRSLFIGFINFIICSIGFAVSILTKEFKQVFVSITFLVFLAEILFLFSIPFQRYYLPLFPFMSIFLSNGLFVVFKKFNNLSHNFLKYFS